MGVHVEPEWVFMMGRNMQPRVSGELSIEGYSDYLFPIADGFLLGIGKDAVPDTNSTDLEGRGAWYQGVKLSLFDVTNPATPLEINSIILGERGTTSEALLDHHAYTFLPSTESHPARITIPLQLHETEPTSGGFDASQPNAWYNWTHTDLYGFEVDLQGTPEIRSAGKWIVEDSSTGQSYPTQADRSLLFGESVHYFRGNTVHSTSWQGLTP